MVSRSFLHTVAETLTVADFILRCRLSQHCIPVSNGSFIPQEFIRLVCVDMTGALAYVNYHAFVRPKAEVDQRCSEALANNRTPQDPRYSVLVLGSDSLSRNSMHRKLPTTLR